MDATVNPPPGATTPALPSTQGELIEIAAGLEDRASVRCLSRALLVGFGALVGLGVTVKLAIDSLGFPWWALVVGAADAIAWVVSLSSAARGRHHLREEAAQFERLQRARDQLGLD